MILNGIKNKKCLTDVEHKQQILKSKIHIYVRGCSCPSLFWSCFRSWHHTQSGLWPSVCSRLHRQPSAPRGVGWPRPPAAPGCEPGSRRSQCGKHRGSLSRSRPERRTGSLWREPSTDHLEHLDTEVIVKRTISQKIKTASRVLPPLKKLTPRMAGWDGSLTLATPSMEFIFPLALYREEEKGTLHQRLIHICSDIRSKRSIQVKSLQQLCIVNSDCPVSERRVSGLDTFPFLK